MVAAAMKLMALNFAKLDKFERLDFRRCQKKMHFLLSGMTVIAFGFHALWCYNIDKTCCGGEACHLDEQNPRCLEDWENLDFQDLVVDGECFQVEVVDFENQKVVERHVVVEMDYKCPVANYPWFKHRDHLVTFEVEEVLECVLLLEMDLDRA
ncbi:hypothetical protein Tco_1110218 [Tanacetum coccineum]|uniref:Transmembrane protein n=1 Tax=Tanacetum coccineum TaxID=301880 RepID=A0ABQ5II87_9ASTR